jgi:PBP1b-binding outer membrane lipoprotein LpoB
VVPITAFFFVFYEINLRMKKYFACLFFTGCFLNSCKNSSQKNEPQNQTEKKNFFPVADYIQSEINYVDSLPVAIIKYSIHNNTTDSSFIHAAEFNQIANDFICDELKPAIFEAEFSETSFIDETTQSTTFTYSTKNNKLELHRVDVLATMGDGSNKVSSVYLEKAMQKNDTLIIKKLLWRTKKSFQIVTSKQFSAKSPEIEQIKVVWDPE